MLLLLSAGCTAVPASERAACAAVPNVVAVSRSGVRVRAGLTTRVQTDRTQDPRGLYDMVQGWADAGELRPACSGEPDVLTSSEATDAIAVLALLGALSHDCSAPARVVLDPTAAPVPLSPTHFCGCRAIEPVEYCSRPELRVYRDGIETRLQVRPIGDEKCSPGAKVFERSPLAPEATPSKKPAASRNERHRGPNRLGEAVAAVGQPSGGLPQCADAYVRFYGAPAWSEVREVLSTFHHEHPHHIIFEVDESQVGNGVAPGLSPRPARPSSAGSPPR